MSQIQIDFEPDLTRQFGEFIDVLRAAVYGNTRQQKAIAADLDYSPSKLSRLLAENPNDTIHFPAYRLPELIEATGDLRIVLWLVAKYLPDEDQRRHAALEAAEKHLAALADLLPGLKDDKPVRAVR